MSVRIYQLSKEIGMENSELIELLSERGFAVKSASSTIDNISADSLVEEFKQKEKEEEKPAEEAPAAEKAKPEEKEKEAASKPVVPPSVEAFVKTPDQIEREKREAEEAKRAAAAPKPAPPPPAAPKPAAQRPAGPATMAPPPAAPRRMAPPAPASPGVKAPPSPSPSATSSPKTAAPPSASPPSGGPKSPPPPRPGAPGSSPSNVPPPSKEKEPEAKKEGEPEKEGEAGEEIRTITLKPPIVLRDLATELGLKPFKLISELMEMGIFASINQSLEEDVASKLAEKRGVILEIRHRGEGVQPKKKKAPVEIDESKLMEPRPPVVCILGHVDHGKTSLLDKIRKANVVEGEAGGITQHIGAYQVEHDGRKITFLDTPGHAAFNAMRARGADVTDVAILVVAADDGFMPQTDEALKYVQKAGVSPIVAINKIDVPGANIDRVKQQMQERGIAPEDWGGQTICVPISALKGEGIEDLLEMILLQAEILELKANPKKGAEGVVIEAQMEVGRGATASVIVQAGTMKVGDALICGTAYTRVKAMFNEYGKPVKEALPATPVRVIGWSEPPVCGAQFTTLKNEKEAKRAAEEARLKEREELAQVAEDDTVSAQDKLFAAIAATQAKTLRVVLKGDVYGSVEAVKNSLQSISSDKVKLEIIASGVGPISKSDVQKASAAGAQIIGFNVKNENGVVALAKHQQVKIVHHQIIYELIDQVKDDMTELLDPEFRETKLGAAEVRAVFPIAKGFVAGCLVIEGRVQSGARARVSRKGETIVESKIETLRRVKDEVKEVRAGTECGIRLARFNNYEEGDVIEVFEVEEIRPSL